jgi:DNA-binding XRE family transcriptional regulator
MHLKDNLRFLRKQEGLTQADLANKLGLKRPVIGAYEEGRAEPRLQTLQLMSRFFGKSIDDLLGKDLARGGHAADMSGGHLRILPIVTDSSGDKERATLVPVKAAAGYLSGYGDVEYIGALPHFNLPFPELSADRSYRVFQIDGESMLPIPSKAYVVCEYVQDWNTIRYNERHVLLTQNDGVVFKRIRPHSDAPAFGLHSDNPDFAPYDVEVNEVLEVWKARGFCTFELDTYRGGSGVKEILERLVRLEEAMAGK